MQIDKKNDKRGHTGVQLKLLAYKDETVTNKRIDVIKSVNQQ